MDEMNRESDVPQPDTPVPELPPSTRAVPPSTEEQTPTDPDQGPSLTPSSPADAWALDKARRELTQWQAKAAEAQARADAEATRARELEASLTQARERLAGEERSRRIDQELIGVGAIDLETARLLAERAMAAEVHADAAKVVRDLRRRKPFLFRTPTFAIAPVAIDEQREPVAAVEEASEVAKENGDRMAILRYLRLKRGV